MRTLVLPLVLLVAGCGEAIEDDHFKQPVDSERSQAAPVRTAAEPVQIGELGGNFPACTVTGATRNLGEGERLDVRAAPFESAEVIGAIPAGTRFHICGRSLDQGWSGIVWDEDSGALSGRCGVSTPVARPQAYDGPCRSGWVVSAFVRLGAG